MNLAVTKLFSRYKSHVSHVLIHDFAHFVAFGSTDFDDLVIRGRLGKRTNTNGLFDWQEPTDDSTERCRELFNDVCDLTDQGTLGSFNVTAEQLKRIDECIKKIDATHVRFHSQSNGVFVSVFDVRRFDYTLRLPRAHEVRLVVDKLSSQSAYTFSATINASTFLKIALDGYTVSIGCNGIVRMIASKADSEYLIRDQEVIEPAIFNDQPDSEIVLWLQTKTSAQEIRTSQLMHLESE
jgi:hypothetical protein